MCANAVGNEVDHHYEVSNTNTSTIASEHKKCFSRYANVAAEFFTLRRKLHMKNSELAVTPMKVNGTYAHQIAEM